MKNKSKIYLRQSAILLAFLLATHTLKAQHTTADSAASVLSQKLGVTPARAAQIHAAFEYHQRDIAQLLTDKTLNPQQKHTQMRFLLKERQHMIDSLLTPEDKVKLKALQNGNDSTNAAAFRQAAMNKHVQDMMRVPHKRTLVQPGADNTQLKPVTNKP